MDSLEPRLLLNADLSIAAFYADGELRIDYGIAGQDAQAFDLTVYRSSDGVTLDAPVATHRVDLLADLAVGSHTSTLVVDFADVQEDYQLIAVIDVADENAESDESNNVAAFAGGVFVSADDTVHVHGDAGVDTVDVSEPADVKVTFNGTLYQYASSDVSAVHIRTHGGDDVVDAGLAVTKVIWAFGGVGADDLTGGARDDYLDGGEGNDALKGRVGNDILEGRSGNDYLVGDAGDDILRGAEGDDILDGQEDDDLLDGGDGADEIFGGYGEDTIFGGEGDDYIEGNQHADYIDAGAGDDTIDGGSGADDIHGGDGNDLIAGSDDPDLIYGDAGNDTIDAGYGNDIVYGGDGDDFIEGKVGADVLYGEAGNDTLDGGIGIDTLNGGSGIDTLDGVTEPNTAPTTSGIADQNEDEDFASLAIDLNTAFEDAEHLDSELTYSLIIDTNLALITSATIDSAGLLTLTSGPDESGAADLTIRATDPLGLYVDAAFTVTVAAVNDAPAATVMPTLEADEDAPDATIDLNAMFDDVDDPDASLTYAIVNNTNPSLFAALTIDAATGLLTLAYASNQNGAADLTIRATDPSGLWVDNTVTVSVAPVNDAPTTSGIADFSVREDSEVLSFDLGDYFDDVEDGAEGLTYQVIANSRPDILATDILITQDPEAPATEAPQLLVGFVPDGCGVATLVIRATDSGGAYVDETVVVEVRPVEDAPVLDGLEDGPDPTIVGADLTLQVGHLWDDSNAVKVSFYRDADGDGLLDTAVDQFLAMDVDAEGGWSVTVPTTGFEVGGHTYFAVAVDSEGLISNVVATTGTVGIVGVLDNAQPGYTEVGSGWVDASSPYSFNGTHRQVDAGTGMNIAAWSFTGLLANAPHRVFVTWSADAANATNATYVVSDGSDIVGTYMVDQTVAPTRFSMVASGGRNWSSWVLSPMARSRSNCRTMRMAW